MNQSSRIILVFLLIFQLLSFTATGQYNISATIKDKNTSESLPWCSVALLQHDSVYNFAFTDDKGYFEIPAAAGSYMLAVRYVGYTPDTIAVKLARKNLYLGTIRLNPDARELEGAEIKESLKNADIDKEEVLVTKQMRTAASSAREVLEKVNGVSYDRYNDAIKVDNDANIIILVNGLEKNREYVKNIDPERIAKIEVVRDPGGRYGIEGYSAIINVVLKQNYQGQELTAMASNIFDYRARSKKGIIPIQNYFLSYNFSRKNLNVYAQGYGNIGYFDLSHEIKTEYNDGKETQQTVPQDMERNMLVRRKSVNVTAGADYQLDSKNIISIEINGSKTPEMPVTFDYNYDFLENDSLLVSMPYNSIQKTTSSNMLASLFYIGNYDERRNLKADITFGRNTSDVFNEFGFSDTAKLSNSTVTQVSYANTNAEWTQVVGKKFSWQAGFGGKWKNSINDNFVDDSASHHKLSELRNKIYAYGTWKITKDLQMKFGFGAENNYAVFDQYERSLWIYKPHFDLFYKPGNMFNLKVKYRVSTSYPDISQTDPTEKRMDAFTVNIGNPKLQPTAVQRVSVKLNVMNGLLYAEPYYEFSDNYITGVGYLRTDGIFVNTFANSGLYRSRGIETGLTIPIGKSIIWQNSADFYHNELAYQEINNAITDWEGESKLIYMNQKWDFMAGVMYQKNNNKIITLQGWYNSRNDYWAMMVQKSFMKKTFNVMILVFLPVDWGADFNQTAFVQTKDYTQIATTDISLLKHLFMLQVNYRFHKGKTISLIKKDIEKEEVNKKEGLF